ncbi:MAG: carboxypeptidase regulatory-like domain-containing protein [Chitinispirillaceae bacterium]|nr:carboxypeptidase regulatory-like domain-containing protein [Chitinispirillaceae bacterium]
MLKGYGWSILFIIGVVISSPAQNVNLSGIISNNSGQGVSGAIVTLTGLNIKDTTDAAGAYSFTGFTGTIIEAPILPSQRKISLNNGILSIVLTGPTPLSIEMFDMRGQLLDRVTDHNASVGEYRFNISRQRYATKMLLLRVAAESETAVLRYIPATSGSAAGFGISTTESGSVLAKALAAVDTIKVSATGYYETSIGIESYKTVKNISLERIAAGEKFSFFVTSMIGLQELSGSENGFGGDLRFGKTGQGAGLLGADSICACLAEMSMPGSSAKKWSAFLSAEKGVDGNQVNAIDRIGEGPWYDRLGRLVANNKSELLNTRPINADSAIINDLPNEYGIPNHRPDPTLPIVDNHMTVTGSDSLGRLFKYTGGSFGTGGWTFSDSSEYGYTCDDWTSTTIRAKPRVGLCWPQSFGGGMGGMGGGMKHWISAMNASGCEAGYDLEESTMAGLPGVYTIGNGGGYGGFYCFAHQP